MRLLNTIHRFDLFMFCWLMNASTRKSQTHVCRYVSKTGNGGLYVILMLAWAWQYGFSYQPLQVMLLAFAIERPTYFVLKNSFKRNRPEQTLPDFHSAIIPSDKFSFPSGHTSAAFMVATLLGETFPPLLFPLFLWASLVGYSRVVIGVHFPTDTLVGCAMGIFIALFSMGQIF